MKVAYWDFWLPLRIWEFVKNLKVVYKRVHISSDSRGSWSCTSSLLLRIESLSISPGIELKESSCRSWEWWEKESRGLTIFFKLELPYRIGKTYVSIVSYLLIRYLAVSIWGCLIDASSFKRLFQSLFNDSVIDIQDLYKPHKFVLASCRIFT